MPTPFFIIDIYSQQQATRRQQQHSGLQPDIFLLIVQKPKSSSSLCSYTIVLSLAS